jgi:hypothetical protein
MKRLLLIALTFFTAIANAEITIVLPEEWKLSGTVIYADGPILTLYSYESCTEKFDEALKVAATIKEK